MFELLLAHPDGVPLGTLAEEVGVPADELREDLLAFYTADPLENDRMAGLWRPPVLEFLGPDGDREVEVPAWIRPALEEVQRRERFTPADLAEHLDERSRLVLCRRLVREGLLTLS